MMNLINNLNDISKKALLALIILSMTNSLAAQTAPGSSEAGYLSTPLRIYWDTIDPIPDLTLQMPGDHHGILNLTHPPLVKLDENWQWQCVVCAAIGEQVPVTMAGDEPDEQRSGASKDQDKSPTVTVYVSTWEIKEHIYWQDGTPVTGRDAKRMLDLLRVRSKAVSQQIRSITTSTDRPREFKILMNKPWPNLPELLAIRLLPELDSTTPGSIPMAYGPWKIKHWTHENILLEAQKFGKNQEPGYQEIHITQFNWKQLNQDLKGNQIPMVAFAGSPEWKATDALNEGEIIQNQGHLQFMVSNKLDVLFFNLRNPKFSDRYLRQALSLALDRSAMNRGVYNNIGFPTDIFFHPSNPACPVTNTQAKNLDLALRLMDHAGWTLINGILKNRDGIEFTVTLTLPDTAVSKKIGLILEHQWKPLGVKVVWDVRNVHSFRHKTIPQADFSDLALATWELSPKDLPVDVFHSDHVPSSGNSFQGMNVAGWINREVDALLEQQAFDPNKLQDTESCGKLAQFFRRDRPMIPLMLQGQVIIQSSHLPLNANPLHLMF